MDAAYCYERSTVKRIIFEPSADNSTPAPRIGVLSRMGAVQG